jgi:hypothetical protein
MPVPAADKCKLLLLKVMWNPATPMWNLATTQQGIRLMRQEIESSEIDAQSYDERERLLAGN